MAEVITKKHSPLTYRIYNELWDNHCGKANAISGGDLSAMFNISERQLRTIIHEIRDDISLSRIILSTNKGYYVPTAEEGTADVKRLFTQAFSTLKIARSTMAKAGLDGQGKLQLGKYYAEFVEAFGEVAQ